MGQEESRQLATDAEGNQIPDNTRPVGKNPITDFTVQWLGYQRSSNSCSLRDLGFTGQLGGRWYSVFGDVLWGAPGVMDAFQQPPGFYGMVRDAVSLLGPDPLVITDLHMNDDYPVSHQLQFIPWNAVWGERQDTGFGGTSICEVDCATATGVVFYLVNANAAGLIGAGVAKVELINGAPTVTKRYGAKGYWWPATTHAHYGDKAAYRDECSNYVYAWGGPPTTVTDPISAQYIYLARVQATDAFDLEKYEYWWGRARGWRSEPLNVFNAETAAMWGVGQGQVVYSAYFGCYVFVNLGFVKLRTAPSPEGPWSADVDIYTAKPIDGGFVYAGVAHPYLDPSGGTLTVSYTNNNHIEVIKITFAKTR